jgi:hypothetical protein
MKKQIIILSLFIIHLSSWSQQASTTTTPCTNEMAYKAKGRWAKMSDLGTMNSAEAFKRLEAIHNFLFTFYSEPVGVDAAWRRNIGLTYFGAKRKHFNAEEGTAPYISMPHFVKYYYECGFFNYYCYEGKMIPGYPGETNAWIKVLANDLTYFIGGDLDCDMNMGGLPVKMRKVLKEKWKGYDVYTSEAGSSDHSVLIHRPGMLPYIPVTRKQYLDHSIKHLTEMYDKIIKDFEKIPVRSLEEQEKEKNAKLEKFKKDFGSDPKKLKTNVDYYLSGYQTDQQRRDERVVKTKKDKTDIVKRFQDELEKTTTEGLLDAPAIVVLMHSPDLFTPIFVTEDKGKILVTDNPDYIRKDLPKHIPQFFVLTWQGVSSGVRGEVGKIIKEKFPIEKLQAMIDK